jgi:hypothetical protein
MGMETIECERRRDGIEISEAALVSMVLRAAFEFVRETGLPVSYWTSS